MTGSSTAAHQIEGNLENNWSKWSEENADYMAEVNGSDSSTYKAGEAVNHYNLFRKDYDIAAYLGHSAHRLSISWSRVMPTKGEINYEELEHYRERVEYLRKVGIEPIVTLWHFSHPIWFSDDGEWVNGDTSYFEDFVTEVVEYLGDIVNYWVTFNEPQGFCWMAYGSDWWPPSLNSKLSYLKAERNMVRTHRKVVDIINTKTRNSKIGIAKSHIQFTSTNLFNRQLSKLGKFICNREFVSRIHNHLDFIGINYYFNKIPTHNGLQNPDSSHNLCPPYPTAISNVIKETWDAHRLPVMVTETGTADENKREWYLINSIRAVKSVRREGIPVIGYLYWTLLDCFEWHSGWSMNFGLVRVNRKTQERHIRDFAYTYRRMLGR